jgi:RNA polymerase sigma factor (sigma-70 family)
LAASMAGQPKSKDAPAEARVGMLERLLARGGESLRRTALVNSSNAADAEDALQDGCVAFMRFYEGSEEGAPAWLSLVVKRFAWQLGRKARRRGSLRYVVTVEPGELSGLEVIPADSRPGTPELVERAEALERRIELLDELKPDERTALILIGFGASYAEIGELRGWSRTKVNRCASEGRARLRELERREGEKT